MAHSSRFLAALAALLLLALAGCSLDPVEFEECSTDDECRRAFGYGSLCLRDGFCSEVQTIDRCDAEPVDFFSNPAPYRDAIVLGVVASFQDNGEELRAIGLAVREINGAGGIGLPPRPFAVVRCNYDRGNDGLDEPVILSRVTDYLVNRIGVSTVIGPFRSPLAKPFFDILAPRDILMISPAATSIQLLGLDLPESGSHDDASPGLFWRTVPTDLALADGIAFAIRARFCREAGVTTGCNTSPAVKPITILYPDDPTVVDLADAIGASYGLDRTNLLPIPPGQDPASALDALRDNPPAQIVWVTPSDTSAVSLLTAIADQPEFDNTRIFLTDNAHTNRLLLSVTLQGIERILPRVQGARPATGAGPVYDGFADRFASAYPGSSVGSAPWVTYAYDAAWLALYANALVFYTDGPEQIRGAKLAEALRTLASPGGRPFDVSPATWPTIKTQLINRNTSIDLTGTSGDLDYDLDFEELSKGSVEIWSIRQGDDCEQTFGTTGLCFQSDELISNIPIDLRLAP